MASFGDYLEKKVLDHVFGKTTFTSVDLYIGLSTTTIADDGSNIAEPVGNGYARTLFPNNTTNWPNATGSGAGGSVKSNGLYVQFSAASGSGWGAITYWFLIDVSSGAGNVYAWAPLTTPRTVLVNESMGFNVGDLVIRLD